MPLLFGLSSYSNTCRSLSCAKVLTCPRVDAMPVPPTPSFNCEREQCGARVSVAYTVQSNPSACVRLAAQRMTTKSNKQSHIEKPTSDGRQIMKLTWCKTNVRFWHKADITVCAAHVRLYPKRTSAPFKALTSFDTMPLLSFGARA